MDVITHSVIAETVYRRCPDQLQAFLRLSDLELHYWSHLPDQVDQDSLPPYDVLDGILQRYMEEDQPIEAILAAGYAAADVQRVVQLLKQSEYKRRQAPPGVRITHRAFGRDWRYPITSKFRESVEPTAG